MLIVVLDTNIWYHETQTIGQDISTTVGGEYDWDTIQDINQEYSRYLNIINH